MRPAARVLAPPFPGELGALLEGVDAAPLIAAASALEPGVLEIAADVAWTPEAEARARMAGFTGRGPTA